MTAWRAAMSGGGCARGRIPSGSTDSIQAEIHSRRVLLAGFITKYGVQLSDNPRRLAIVPARSDTATLTIAATSAAGTPCPITSATNTATQFGGAGGEVIEIASHSCHGCVSHG